MVRLMEDLLFLAVEILTLLVLLRRFFSVACPAFTAVRGRFDEELFNRDWRIFYRRLGLFSLLIYCRGCIEALLAVVKKF